MDYAKFCAREIFDYQPIILSKCDFFFLINTIKF